MMYTVRELIIDAYDDAMIRSEGMTLTPMEMTKGVKQVQQILGKEYQSGNFLTTTVSLPVAFTGTDAYTIGPMPDTVNYPDAPVPDFEIDVAPSDVCAIIIISGNNARITCMPLPAGPYFTRGVTRVENEFPSEFYYERTAPLATIRFNMGTPQGPGEIIYKPSYENCTVDTDTSLWPLGLVVYMKWAVASNLSAMNRFDNTWLATQAKAAYEEYKRANYKGQSMMMDGSAAGMAKGRNSKFFLYTGELV